KEIQVEAEVKLEVLAKFCAPRPNDIPVPTPSPGPGFRCPPIVFPPQCPTIFPRANCDCQATANTLITGVPVSLGLPPLAPTEIGTVQLIADICP
ncbi:hypothetical protein H1215_10685, partial [Anoxybacillus sp. LAT_38]|nr:hypothetical protein [Anoxybacillus sp. LAT_38]